MVDALLVWEPNLPSIDQWTDQWTPCWLDDTATAQWRRRLAGVQTVERRHWRTRTAYYAAVSALLAAGSPRPTWSQIIAEVRPRGSRTTFYEIAGPHAKQSLVTDLLGHNDIDLLQLALLYRRAHAGEQLIDEAKVWSYWPYRECMAMRYRTGPQPDQQESIELLEATLTTWAAHCGSLASALHCAPPACAVEDLLHIRPGQMSVRHAAGALTRVIERAVSDGPAPAG